MSSCVMIVNLILMFPAQFESREWKPVAEPFPFPSSDEPPPPDYEHEFDDRRPLDDQHYIDEHVNHRHGEL